MTSKSQKERALASAIEVAKYAGKGGSHLAPAAYASIIGETYKKIVEILDDIEGAA